ncbi:hypothetical protein SAMN05444397_101708 [Flavobacterium aquidurense]|uniref:Lipoprotein n=1 Tax=Flavobacterium frigidimaris TaxID=262320 RepID=A0ABX4BTI9_FLAFR|nr:hypothetical protein [Flavobacterium frigidimaris]OXA80994.1 hypothetical protein B0A65_05335 [Flavobacterium frigidimaris]SDY46423.1 hypothetical protein SAMN05444397_101708 [Flavobacterium aquidurense]
MKNSFRLLVIIFFACFFASCDPAHNIEFVNKKDSDVKVKINLDSQKNNFRLEQITDKDSAVYLLKRNDTANIYCGIGVWSKKEIETFVKGIKSVEIETKDVKTIYKSRKAITQLFEKNTKGIIFKAVIEINVK